MSPAARNRSLLAILALALVLPTSAALAASSLGIGNSEATVPSSGMFGHLLLWINTQQQHFYRALTGAMKSMRDGGGGAMILVGLSFAYGIFHAAGPGHGKAVISSYMLANEAALRRGVFLSFVSAMLQALTAIAVISAAFLVLRGTAVSMTDAAQFLETSSYLLIACFGGWLLWRKGAALLRPAPVLALADRPHAHGDHDGHRHGHAIHHHHRDGETCDTCGHSHAPDPQMLAGERLDWKTAWSAVAAVGIRPCSGALIVLTFAFLNGLFTAGVGSVFAMAMGTAITVSAFATLAVTAKRTAVAISGGGALSSWIHHGIELAGASLVLFLGLTLFAASIGG